MVGIEQRGFCLLLDLCNMWVFCFLPTNLQIYHLEERSPVIDVLNLILRVFCLYHFKSLMFWYLRDKLSVGKIKKHFCKDSVFKVMCDTLV